MINRTLKTIQKQLNSYNLRIRKTVRQDFIKKIDKKLRILLKELLLRKYKDSLELIFSGGILFINSNKNNNNNSFPKSMHNKTMCKNCKLVE